MAKKTANQQQRQVDAWNGKYPVGTPVKLRKNDGTSVKTVTRSKAELLGGHTAVVWLEGVVGCYCLTHVRPL
jgi:hypothetical protein